jgi:hypothetical protein
MSKYKIEEVVKFDKRPGLFVVTQIEEGARHLEYSIMVKSAFDNWNPEIPETFPAEYEIFNSVSETEISKIF